MAEATGTTQRKTRAERKAERESFPPKWLLGVAILAVIGGMTWGNYRMSATEAALTATKEVVQNAPTPAPAEVTVLPAETTGRDGRGIADASCVLDQFGNGRWQITYTDKVVKADAGPCYVPPAK